MAFLWSTLVGMPLRGDEPAALEIGDRREVFFDDFLIEGRRGVELRLQKPTPREIVLVHDAPGRGAGADITRSSATARSSGCTTSPPT